MLHKIKRGAFAAEQRSSTSTDDRQSVVCFHERTIVTYGFKQQCRIDQCERQLGSLQTGEDACLARDEDGDADTLRRNEDLACQIAARSEVFIQGQGRQATTGFGFVRRKKDSFSRRLH
jgi:hypothetical protein